jgi:hypothetical protein
MERLEGKTTTVPQDSCRHLPVVFDGKGYRPSGPAPSIVLVSRHAVIDAGRPAEAEHYPERSVRLKPDTTDALSRL